VAPKTGALEAVAQEKVAPNLSAQEMGAP
jgi:hypothetical protein